MTKSEQVAAVIPAAGIGQRMQSELPKQYLKLGGRSVLEWTVRAISQDPRIRAIYIAISPDDPYFQQQHFASACPIVAVEGGATRAASVAAGVERAVADGFTWVAVHDAARPCLTAAELEQVVTTALADEVGALLALPVADTLKRSSKTRRSEGSVAREHLWQAQTPQVFRAADLQRGWQQLGTDHPQLTDEASVLEALGLQPQLVPGRRSNIKITQPGDDAIARLLLFDDS
ncbi:2-C-methyl-D-erythritol 4-phosphate cytidylyltransferase [Pseudidiomarina terrestris]|uniref:2-C-methyl-D-erythritol 4-phosphate cytidylyltransferase n=1 Tax=Pseudidiomarina terrestris TaxID=2820060 RepID=A0AAW7QVW4_9GAMM|nr:MULTISPECIES: 2-C-methyl-D-erythritol 4-phosphate cytidylyltransferase [unclassified Pseudidiomarina]MDN7123597.1 2-C-methyl-D-erythritol 4-phosphate cytidylyltransferase [Pseudidiomarina sp. 1APP75-32.1]MDN7126613.1 2-C-methyl-D-erythritol 4-phosphate cytidylyltransferase [Pseudidiomarina sp. 1APR75-33.1]MDN7128679.1 2-C-methyl-D-erythritol 4-phosphate cytidylyltransferase [Pseudidiomarina sp. 1APR75-15]MDN7135062.1 2-C-methyl-D-erythritol 4-phosphate cytidylyltransferase [Pseudidiomarina s